MTYDHKGALERFESHSNAEADNVKDAQSDLKHLAGDQWDPAAKKNREADGRPVLTVNKLGQFVNQVVGDIRQSEPAIEAVPVDSETDPDFALVMGGLIRQIEYQSNARAAYNWAAYCQASCGIGHLQILTEYADDTTFDQDIRIKRILDPLSVTWEAGAVELDRSDAQECFVSEWIPEERYKRIYKDKAKPSDFPSGASAASSNSWYGGADRVRIASHWYKVEIKKNIGLTIDGKVVDLDENPGIPVIKTRQVKTYKIMHCKLSGSDVLDDPKEAAGKHIPVVPFIGNEISVDGTILRHGLIRYAKDPQSLYNSFRSAAAEVVMMQPKAPWLVPSHSIEGYEEFWKKANTNIPYLPFVIDPAMPNARPERIAPPAGSAVMYQEVQVSEADMYGTTGIYPSSLGGKSNETSGRAINARQREADTGSYVYQDNFKTSMKRVGDILVDLIPRIYDATRPVRVLGEDGLESMKKINVVQQNPVTGEEIILNDLSAHKFDVRIKVGSSYASNRERAVEALTTVMQQPGMFQVVGDLWAENLDSPISAKLAARIKKTMPQELVGEGGAQAPQVDPMQQQMAELQVENAAADVRKKDAETALKQVQAGNDAFELGFRAHRGEKDEPSETAQSSAA